MDRQAVVGRGLREAARGRVAQHRTHTVVGSDEDETLAVDRREEVDAVKVGNLERMSGKHLLGYTLCLLHGDGLGLGIVEDERCELEG